MSKLYHDGASVVPPGRTYKGKLNYGAGASAEMVGAARMCMKLLPMPPDAIARAHYHEGIETIAYML